MNSLSLNDSVKIELEASEPWKKDCKLFMPFNEQMLLYEYANCISVQAFLKMCKLNFEIEHRTNAEHMSPSGEVPFIKCGAFVVSELLQIVSFAEKKGHSLTQKVNPQLKSTMEAYIDMVNTVLLFAEMYICWCDKYTIKYFTYSRYTFPYPWPLNKILFYLKKSRINQRLSINLPKKDLESVLENFEECLEKLTELLEDKPYFFGERPTELDALVFGHLSAILTSPLPNNKLAEIVHRNEQLINYHNHIDNEYFKRQIP